MNPQQRKAANLRDITLLLKSLEMHMEASSRPMEASSRPLEASSRPLEAVGGRTVDDTALIHKEHPISRFDR